ncbi:MAG: hypothetical protein B6226_01505 [Candidatus Cloacimonetes bacterium 4572_65]|nr:MAG: hypothetical protein B6226_01505 [Candidatus Cloacimonetes bacterium 4572_65]
MKRVLILAFLVIISMGFAQATLPSCYWTNEEIHTKLMELEQLYPDVCSVEIAGYSQEDNMPIYMVKLSDNVAEFEEDEPVVLLNGPLHAEEILGVNVTMDTIIDILENRHQPPYLMWLNNLQVYLIPILNPEGYEVVMDGTDTSYRKNKRDTNNNGLFDFNPNVGYDVDGVDNNRNFPFNWVHGDTLYCPIGTEVYDYYRGEAPLSESETRIVYDFCEEFKPVYSVQWHSSRSGNFSEKVYFPWYWYDVRQSPDFDIAEHIAQGMANEILKEDETGPYECYPGKGRKGAEDNTLYQEFGTIQILIECGTLNLQPDSLGMQFVSDECNDGVAWLLNRALPFSNDTDTNSLLTGVVTDAVTGEFLEAEVALTERNPVYFRPRLTRAESGRYWRPLLSGQYTLEVKKEGYYTHTQSINVLNNLTTKNVALEPLPNTNSTLAINISGFTGAGKVTIVNHDYEDLVYVTEDIQNNNTASIALLSGNISFTFESNDKYFEEDFVINNGPNNILFDIASYEQIYTEDFTSIDDWTGTDNWTIKTYVNSAGNSESFLTDSEYFNFTFEEGFDNSFYEPNCDYQLILNSPITINPDSRNYIELEHWLYSEWLFDFAIVEISSDNSEWTEIWSKAGQFDYLHKDWILIPDTFEGDQLYIKLRFVDDNAEPRLVDPGWNINNLTVRSYDVNVTPNAENSSPVVISSLGNNYPNPFNPETVISFTLDAKSTHSASIDIYNIKGQKVETLPLTAKEITSGRVTWNAGNNSSGVYLYRLKANNKVVDIKKATLLK